MASALPGTVEEDRVSAMSAAMLSLGERIASELARGSVDQVYVKGDNGYVILMAVGTEAVLTALARKGAKLGVIEPGAYADLLIVDGDPVEDIMIMLDYENNFKLIMKDGEVFKNTL